MARKVILIADPGIDGAFAIALALFDPNLDVLAICPTAGNISPDQATRNVYLLVEHFDPPKWPRVAEALPVSFDMDGSRLHGSSGLGGLTLPTAELHRQHPADKLLVETVRLHPGEVTVMVLGPCTALAQALDRDLELARHVQQFIVVGGAWHEPGNSGPVSEFHFVCDPLAARKVLKAGAPTILLPLDATRQALFSPTELTDLPCGNSRGCELLRRIVPFGVSATAQLYGIEGFHLKDVLGVFALAEHQAVKSRPMAVDVETRGELTMGMCVVDQRPERGSPNVDLVTEFDARALRAYMRTTLGRMSDETPE
jgi:inosine-uridine nucleoside N-ribohydrolase